MAIYRPLPIALLAAAAATMAALATASPMLNAAREKAGSTHKAFPEDFADMSAVSSKQVGAAINFDVDVNGLIDSIGSGIAASQDRGAFVQSARDKAAYFHMSNGNQIIDQYNVMVFNRQQPNSNGFENVEFYYDFNYQGITYGVWIFEKGWFRNEGDGGYINWAFSGSFDRNEGYVNFLSRK
jgi:hypothetical protein